MYCERCRREIESGDIKRIRTGSTEILACPRCDGVIMEQETRVVRPLIVELATAFRLSISFGHPPRLARDRRRGVGSRVHPRRRRVHRRGRSLRLALRDFAGVVGRERRRRRRPDRPPRLGRGLARAGGPLFPHVLRRLLAGGDRGGGARRSELARRRRVRGGRDLLPPGRLHRGGGRQTRGARR